MKAESTQNMDSFFTALSQYYQLTAIHTTAPFHFAAYESHNKPGLDDWGKPQFGSHMTLGKCGTGSRCSKAKWSPDVVPCNAK